MNNTFPFFKKLKRDKFFSQKESAVFGYKELSRSNNSTNNAESCIVCAEPGCCNEEHRKRKAPFNSLGKVIGNRYVYKFNDMFK